MKKKITINGIDYTPDDFPAVIGHGGNYTSYTYPPFAGAGGYVGITEQSQKERQRNGYDHNKAFSQAIEDHGGFDNIPEPEITHDSMSKEVAGKIEKLRIAQQHTLWPHGFNKQDGGFEDVHTIRDGTYPVKQIDPVTGEVLCIWHTPQFAEDYGEGKEGQALHASKIRACANHYPKHKTHGGWAWEKATWEEFIEYDEAETAKLPRIIHLIEPQHPESR